jgi:hypothetical protein
MDADPIGLVVRILPALFAVILSSFNFNRSVMILGIEAHQDLCPTFEEAQKNNYRCLRPGATALTTGYAAISISASYLISALLVSDLSLRSAFLVSTLIMIIGTFAFFWSYKKEVFTLEEALEKANHKWWADHVGLGANLIALLISLLLAVMTMMSN